MGLLSERTQEGVEASFRIISSGESRDKRWKFQLKSSEKRHGRVCYHFLGVVMIDKHSQREIFAEFRQGFSVI
jgi:hypothetical protein